MENVKYIPGDLVIYQGQICKVKGSILHFTKLLYNVKDNMVDAESLQGLSLTPQILEANGWKEVPLAKGHYIRQQGISIFKNINGEGFLAQYEIGITVNIEFVHQLQHLLFGLELNHKKFKV